MSRTPPPPPQTTHPPIAHPPNSPPTPHIRSSSLAQVTSQAFTLMSHLWLHSVSLQMSRVQLTSASVGSFHRCLLKGHLIVWEKSKTGGDLTVNPN